MKQTKIISVMAVICGCIASSSTNAATLPAGTTITVSTVSAFSSKTVVGRTFEAKLAQDVAVKGHVLLKAGSKVFGKIASSRYNPRKNDPLTVELISVSVNGRNVAVKTNAFQPGSPPVNDYSWNLDAIPASSASDVVAAVQRVSTRRLSDTGF